MQRIHSDDQSTESKLQALGKTAPRVTPADIEGAIASEHYFTAADGVLGAYRAGGDVHPEGGTPSKETNISLGLLTFCVLALENGFTVTGESACVSPENFDAQIGRDVARKAAVEKMWPLLGYALKDSIHRDQKMRTQSDACAGQQVVDSQQ